MTEAERQAIDRLLSSVMYYASCQKFNDVRKVAIEISTYCENCTKQSMEDIDDWSENVEARLTNLEKRVSMINAFYVAKEAEENERRKAREKPLHAGRRYRKRTIGLC